MTDRWTDDADGRTHGKNNVALAHPSQISQISPLLIFFLKCTFSRQMHILPQKYAEFF